MGDLSDDSGIPGLLNSFGQNGKKGSIRDRNAHATLSGVQRVPDSFYLFDPAVLIKVMINHLFIAD